MGERKHPRMSDRICSEAVKRPAGSFSEFSWLWEQERDNSCSYNVTARGDIKNILGLVRVAQLVRASSSCTKVSGSIPNSGHEQEASNACISTRNSKPAFLSLLSQNQ